MNRKLAVNLVLILIYLVYLRFIKPAPETKICTTFHGPNNYTRYQCEVLCCGAIGQRHCCPRSHLYAYDMILAEFRFPHLVYYHACYLKAVVNLDPATSRFPHLVYYHVCSFTSSQCDGLGCVYRFTMGLYASCVIALDFFWFLIATRPRIILPQRLLRPRVGAVVAPPIRRSTSVGNRYFPRTSGGDDSVLA